MNIPILKELERLKTAHATAKVNSSTFQPDEQDQKALIFRNEQRREEFKRIIEEKLKAADAKLLEQEQAKNKLAAASLNNESSEQDRAQTAPTAATKLGRSRSFKYSGNESLRPQTSAGVPHSTSFDAVLKVAPQGGDFSNELRTQVERQARDGRRIFEALFHHFKTGGVGCQFSAKRPFEVIDISNLAASSAKLLGGTSTLKLEDINAMKKKDSIALIFDPTTDTAFAEVTIRVYYQKAVDLLTEQSCSRDYTFCSDGNHFGMQLVDDIALARWAHQHGGKTTKGGGGGGEVSPSGRLSPVAPPSPTDSPSKHDGAAETLWTGGSRAGSKGERSLPGWQGRPPIFVPSSRCSIEVVSVTPADPSGAASTEYHLSHLRVFAVAGASLKAAMRKVHDFCDSFFIADTANLVVTGGISALNLAALHGNLEVGVYLSVC
jgi:hypothetical protein